MTADRPRRLATDGGPGEAPRGDEMAARLRERVLAIAEDWDGVEAVEMFGLPSFTVDGELFCVVSPQGVSLTKLPEEDRAALEDLVEVEPFDADGRTVERWATVSPDALPDDAALEPFLRASYAAAQEFS